MKSVEPLQGSLLGAREPELAPDPVIERITLDAESWIDVSRGWLLGADTLLEQLAREVPWRQHRRVMYDKVVDEPRVSKWYRGDEALPHPVMRAVGAALTQRYQVLLGSVGLNYYRNGRDSVAWHRDTELRTLDRTLVCIVTLGAARPFLVRPHGGGPSQDIHPASGDLLVMGGSTQKKWEHCVPKVASSGPRISMSLRWSSGKGTPERRRNYRSVGSRPARRTRAPYS
jgi:alkylated DNA repair dioxygenase AlkB